MAFIPDLPTEVPGRKAAVAPSIEAATASGRALSSLGQSIATVAGIAGEIADNYQSQEDAGIRNAARLRMQQAQANHQLFRESNPDESEWSANLDKELSQARADLFEVHEKRMSPLLRKELETTFKGWELQGKTETARDAIRQSRSRNRTTTTQLVEEYKKRGRFEDARAALSEAAAANVFSPDELEADLQFLDLDQSSYQARQQATKYELAEPEDLPEVLEILSAKNEDGSFANDPEIDEATRGRLVKFSEKRLEQATELEFDSFKGAIDRGEITEADLQSMPQFLGEREKSALASYFKRNQPPTDEEDRAAWNEIGTIRELYQSAKAGSVDEVEFRRAHREARTKILESVPAGYNGPLLETLQRYSPARIYDPAESAPKPDDLKKDIGVEIRSISTAAFDAGFFGTITEDTPPMEREKAARKRRDVERKALEWINRQKDPTPEAAREYMDGLLSKDRVASTAADFRQFIPGSGQRFRPAATMPALPPKTAPRDKAAADPLGIPPGPGTASDALLPPREQLEGFLNPTTTEQ